MKSFSKRRAPRLAARASLTVASVSPAVAIWTLACPMAARPQAPAAATRPAPQAATARPMRARVAMGTFFEESRPSTWSPPSMRVRPNAGATSVPPRSGSNPRDPLPPPRAEAGAAKLGVGEGRLQGPPWSGCRLPRPRRTRRWRGGLWRLASPPDVVPGTDEHRAARRRRRRAPRRDGALRLVPGDRPEAAARGAPGLVGRDRARPAQRGRACRHRLLAPRRRLPGRGGAPRRRDRDARDLRHLHLGLAAHRH